MAKTGKKRQAAQYGVQDIGVRGRRTGISIPETGKRDEYGMDDLEDFFNREPRSVGKRAAIASRNNSSANKRQKPSQDVTNSQEVTMEEASAPTPPSSNRISPKRRGNLTNNAAAASTPRQATIARKLTYEGSNKASSPQRQKSIFKQPARPLSLSTSPSIVNGTPKKPLEASGLRKVQKRQSAASQGLEDNLSDVEDDVFVDAEPPQEGNEPVPVTRLPPHSPHKSVTKQYSKSPGSARKSYRPSMISRGREASLSIGSGDDELTGGMLDNEQHEDMDEEEEEMTQPDAHENGVLSEQEDVASPEPEPAPTRASRKAKGKQTASPKPKQGRATAAAAAAKQAKGKAIKNTVAEKGSSADEPEKGDENSTGLRRSSRSRMSPLAYWRNERIVYELVKRRQSGPLVPEIKEIIKVESPKVEVRHTKPKKSVGSRKPVGGKKESLNSQEEEISEPEDWAERGHVSANISGFGEKSDQQTRAKIAFSGSAIRFTAKSEHSLRICKMYEDDEFLAAGFIELPKNGFKSLKNVKENSVMFCVISGSVEITVADAVFILKQGGTCWVPRGNFYSIANKSKTTSCRLFFAQATNTLENEELGINNRS